MYVFVRPFSDSVTDSNMRGNLARFLEIWCEQYSIGYYLVQKDAHSSECWFNWI